MKKFIIAIEEMSVKEFEIVANDDAEAIKVAQEKYKKGEIVLDPGEVQFKQICITHPQSDVCEWFEF